MTSPLPPKLYFRIGEVAGLVGVEPHVLRYWEREFRSIRPTKSAKGQRVYSRKDVEALIVVKDLLYAQGFTIAGAKKKLQRPTDGRAAEPAALLADGGDAVLAMERAQDHAEAHARVHASTEQAHQRAGTHEVHDVSFSLAAAEALDGSPHAASQHSAQYGAQQALAVQVAVQVAESAARHSEAQAAENGAALEGARGTLIALRAEVEALLHELGG